MSGFGHKVSSFFWWSYPRGSLEYDIMVAIILAFIFLTPRAWFHDQPKPGHVTVTKMIQMPPAALPQQQ